MLAGEAVLASSVEGFAAQRDLTLPERLLSAMEAAEGAGGDRRGQQSAALLLTTTEDFADLNIRVDDHANPLAELRRLLSIWREQWPQRAASEQGQPLGLYGPRCDRGRLEATLNLRFRR
jgi:uncharacterized Ntn-hydrolase superfamily protein